MRSVSAQWNLCTLCERLHDCVVWCLLGSYLFITPRWLTFEATIIRLSSFTVHFSMLDSVSVTGRMLEFVALTSTLSSMEPRGRYPSTKTIAQKMKLTGGQHASESVFSQTWELNQPCCYRPLLFMLAINSSQRSPAAPRLPSTLTSNYLHGTLMAKKLSRTRANPGPILPHLPIANCRMHFEDSAA